MPRPLKQSTSVDVPIGPFVDSTDGVTAETALTITQPDIRLKKNNANWAQKAAAQTLTHEENGYYEVTLDATDTDTLGLLRLAVNESGACPIWEDFVVLPANIYDSMFSTDKLEVDVVQWGGSNIASPASSGHPVVTVKVGTGTGEINVASGKTPSTIAAGDIANNAITAASIAADAITAAKIATGAIDADALAADAVDEIWDEAIGDGTITARQAMRVAIAVLAGKLSGAATTTVTIRNGADSADVVVATVDANGNRTATTITP